MPRKRTNAEWLIEVKKLVKDEYTFLDEYINKETKIAVVHSLCGKTYKVAPGAFLRGNRCPYCRSNRRKTTDEFKKEVYQLVGDEYTVISDYTGHHKPISLKHEKCKRVYSVAPSDFLKGRRCKQCHFDECMKTNQEWLDQVKELAGDDYTFLERYKGDNVKIKYKHVCGHIHKVTPNNFINGTRCTACKESIGEANVRRFLTEAGMLFESQKSFKDLVVEKQLSYDFFLPNYNILLEFQGEQHYRPITFFGGEKAFKKQCVRDELKRSYAKEKGLKVIEIPYTHDTYEKVKMFLDTTMSKHFQCNVKQGTLHQNLGL